MIQENGSALYQARIKRIADATELKKPDRVPIIFEFGTFIARYAGITVQDLFYDLDKCVMAWKKAVTSLEPDAFIGLSFDSGGAMEAVDSLTVKWPGHGLAPDRCHQYVEGEYMMADEYDAFLEDPTGFLARTYLPRTCGALGELKNLPVLMKLIGFSRGRVDPVFAGAGFLDACRAVLRASTVAQAWHETWKAFVTDIEARGYPAITLVGVGQAPFDFFSDHLRGMKGIMLDMFRQPDKLLAAMDKILPIMLRGVKDLEPSSGNRLVFMGPHRGAEGFMSLKQFEKFYWPGLKAGALALIERGFTPLFLWEGDYTSRLNYLAELPPGKIIHRFDRTDVYKAREVLGARHCIAGGILPSLLRTGSAAQVKDECKRLIEVVGRDGAYIMSHSTPLDEARLENILAMIEATREYGIYR